ncbi:TetR/AcrR family transcriptional regulator [Nocardioides guangzhouensis]|uniref:TetR/AcrR family transcriptional regulator n=1 Tax=Nocardioides guangzhouensis TaxID=2497878 RepID=A0A4Q4Z7P2_9ACTN|nr:TetR/AcrR family transcriptional regulator [Nocardioides guangzhouensis]RYP83880.1 TetR/AcrR family transcriptional regulator [Nocardioides guangzhouensis]
MTSDRHNGYLDAARDCILDVGWKRTTLTDVARRAGVSRMTIYRAWPDMQTLLADLMTREWAGVATAVPEGEDVDPDRIATGVVAAVRALRANPLFRRILDVDPELVVPYLLDRRGRSQDLILDALAARVTAGQDQGRLRAGDPVLLARTVLLAAHGFALSAHTMADGGLTEAELDDELGRFLARGLAP